MIHRLGQRFSWEVVKEFKSSRKLANFPIVIPAEAPG